MTSLFFRVPWTCGPIHSVCLGILLLMSITVGAHGTSPPWIQPTSQRMYVGIITEEDVIGYTVSQVIWAQSNQKCDALNWYQGDLDSGTISPLWLFSDYGAGRTHTLRWQHNAGLRRWHWENNQFWFGFEALYGPIGPHGCSLWQTQRVSDLKVDRDGFVARDVPRGTRYQDQKVLIESCAMETRADNTEERVEKLSDLEPLRRSIQAMNKDMKFGGRDEFRHSEDGFDFIPRTPDHWSLFMTVDHTMQIWDCQSERVTTEKGEGICNTWRLESEFWVPWRGQYFVIKVSESGPKYFYREYTLVRDCGEVYELKTQYENAKWRGEQLLNPVDYLIALLYIEPENIVYGFGPNFYVRLDAPVNSLERKPCRYVTEGKALWTDEKGEVHELVDPFRTVWQCANVLKEDGVLDELSHVVDDSVPEEERTGHGQAKEKSSE